VADKDGGRARTLAKTLGGSRQSSQR